MIKLMGNYASAYMSRKIWSPRSKLINKKRDLWILLRGN